MGSRARLTLVGPLWGARAIVKSTPTRATHQAAARALTTLLQPARILGSPIIPTSVRPSHSPA
jgi:hypothetical protein